MNRWLRMAPLLAVMAVAAALLIREQSRRTHEATATATAARDATRPAPGKRGEPRADRAASRDTTQVEAAPRHDDSEELDDIPPKVDPRNPASVAAYRDYFARQARQYGEYIGPIIFEDSGADMKLDPATTQALVALYVEFYARSNAASHAPDKSQAQKAQELEAIRLDRERALQELLGAGGMKSLERYRRTIPARLQVQALVHNLDSSRFRLSEAQRRRLLDALLKPGAYSPDREYSLIEPPEAVRQEVLTRFDQNERQLLDAARRILTPNQFGVCVLYLEKSRQAAIVEATPYFARDLGAR